VGDAKEGARRAVEKGKIRSAKRRIENPWTENDRCWRNIKRGRGKARSNQILAQKDEKGWLPRGRENVAKGGESTQKGRLGYVVY